MDIDKSILDKQNLKKLEKLDNPKVMEIVERFVKHCKPAKVTVLTDSKEDIDYARQLALDTGEEKKLVIEGHTVHYDSYQDQARDKAHTCVLLPKGQTLSKHINTIDRDTGLFSLYPDFQSSNSLPHPSLAGGCLVENGSAKLGGFFCEK